MAGWASRSKGRNLMFILPATFIILESSLGSTLSAPIIIIGGLGLAFGVVLAIASKLFEVKIDPRVEQITDALPVQIERSL